MTGFFSPAAGWRPRARAIHGQDLGDPAAPAGDPTTPWHEACNVKSSKRRKREEHGLGRTLVEHGLTAKGTKRPKVVLLHTPQPLLHLFYTRAGISKEQSSRHRLYRQHQAPPARACRCSATGSPRLRGKVRFRLVHTPYLGSAPEQITVYKDKGYGFSGDKESKYGSLTIYMKHEHDLYAHHHAWR